MVPVRHVRRYHLEICARAERRTGAVVQRYCRSRRSGRVAVRSAIALKPNPVGEDYGCVQSCGLTVNLNCRTVSGGVNSAQTRQSKTGGYMDPPGWFPLIVRGGHGVSATYDGSTLTVQFRKSSVAAGNPTTYRNMPFGSAAWVDRPLNDAEPFALRQQMNGTDAESAIEVLRINDRFWNFVCRNTNTGHFEVLRSEPAFMQVPID